MTCRKIPPADLTDGNFVWSRFQRSFGTLKKKPATLLAALRKCGCPVFHLRGRQDGDTTVYLYLSCLFSGVRISWNGCKRVPKNMYISFRLETTFRSTADVGVAQWCNIYTPTFLFLKKFPKLRSRVGGARRQCK